MEGGKLFRDTSDDSECDLCSRIEQVQENCRYAEAALDGAQTDLEELRQEPKEKQDEEEIKQYEIFAHHLDKIL